MAAVVYRSLGEVLTVLKTLEPFPEVRNLLALCANRGLSENAVNNSRNVSNHPFVVIEGLDGTGKTTLTKFLSASLNMKLIPTPPKIPVVQEARNFFDSQPESMRRAYYSLGNYLAAQDVLESEQPVAMDRFWHSTAAYAMAHQRKMEELQIPVEHFVWPEDLLKPDLIIFLQVSEQERVRRHKNRKEFTDTDEEKTLASNEVFRNDLVKLYRSITGPEFIELNADGEQPFVEAKLLETVLKHFPALEVNRQQQVN